MRKTRKVVVLIMTLLLLMLLSVPAYADGYIIRKTTEVTTYVNGVPVGYSVTSTDLPDCYGPAPTATTVAATTTQALPAATTTAALPAATTAAQTGSSKKWVPNWGANYAAEQAKYMNSSKSSSSSCWKPQYSAPVVYVTNSSGRTLGDEARSQAESLKDYALDKKWTVSVSGDWGDCSYRNIELKFENAKEKRTYRQVTVLQDGSYVTYYEYDGHSFVKDDVKYFLKDRAT